MDTHIADDKLAELHVEELVVKANDRCVERYEIDPEAEKKLLRKLDLRVVPALWFLYMLAFLDRTNIGNAKIQGLTKDLKMTGNDYNIALMIFFPSYIVFEVPSNILIKRLAPSTWLSLIMFLWGVITIFPGCMYLISMYYKRYENQWRFNIFFSGSILAGSFSGLLAYAIAHMDGVAGYAGWRWIFILEGLVTAIVAIASKWFIVDWPETATFLTNEEKRLLIARLSADVADAKMNRLDKPAVKRIFSDWKMYLGRLMYMGIVNTGYATSFFSPTILTELGYKAEKAQVRSIPIFIVAAVLCMATAWCSDRLRHRYAFAITGICIATIGYVVLLCQHSVSINGRYAAIFLIVSGGYMCQPITLGWINNTMGGHYKRSVASAFQGAFDA
ncbi:hypothetical protein LTR33_009367 [Friedmanniomyces endolithicus]|nr:hypothetical protein LTR33_009367 [Friedmanniomyces endolithicus]